MIGARNENHSAVGAAEWLGLAAAPTFAIMAVATRMFGADMPAMICSMSHAAAPIGGMVPMYVLMSVFHSAPWLKLIGRQLDGMRNI